MNLPEGLRLEGGASGHSHITDAQGHVWVTIHPAGPGDPDNWRTAIVGAVCDGLSAAAARDTMGLHPEGVRHDG